MYAQRESFSFTDPEHLDIKSGVRELAPSRQEERDSFSPEVVITEDPFESIREAAIHRLMHDAGLRETASVPGTGEVIRVEYSEEAKQELFDLFLNWMRPFTDQLETDIAQRMKTDASPAPEEVEAVRQGFARMIMNALQSATFSHVRLAPEDEVATYKDRIDRRVLAMRGILLHRPDWFTWVSPFVKPSTLPQINRLVGFSGVSADKTPSNELKNRGLMVRNGALVPLDVDDSWNGEVFEMNRMKGEKLRERFEVSFRGIAYLNELQTSLVKHEESMGNLTGILQARQRMRLIMEKISAVSQRVLEIDTRQQRNAMHLQRELETGDTFSEAPLQRSNEALEEEKAACVRRRVQLIHLRDVYWDIAGQLDRLAESGISFGNNGTVTMRELRGKINEYIEERSISRASSAYAE